MQPGRELYELTDLTQALTSRLMRGSEGHAEERMEKEPKNREKEVFICLFLKKCRNPVKEDEEVGRNQWGKKKEEGMKEGNLVSLVLVDREQRSL